MNHNPPHDSSHEVLNRRRGGSGQAVKLFAGCGNDVLSSGRRVFWLREPIHNFAGGLQERLQPERNLPFNIMGWKSRRPAACFLTVNPCWANIIAVPLSTLRRTGGRESIALGILQ